MKSKGQVALAVSAGYMLGRTHRMKMALMLAAAGATGRFPGGPRDLLERGTKMLASSPEVARISDSVRQELVSAAKAAAVTAASQRIDSLSNRLLAGGGPAGGTVEGVKDVSGTVGEVAGVGRFGRRKNARSRDDEQLPVDQQQDEEPDADDDSGSPDDSGELVVDAEVEAPDDDEADEEPAPRKRPAARRRTSSTGSTRPAGKTRKTNPDQDDEEEAPKRSSSSKTRAKAPTDSAPVRRVRR